MVSTKT